MESLKVKVFHDVKNEMFTSCFEMTELAGPIISANTLEKVKEKFNEAHKLWCGISCILRYSTHGDFDFLDFKNIDVKKLEFYDPIEV